MAGLLAIPKAVAKASAKDAGLLSPSIRAYHGSPHDFDRFSTDAIGTGEGAQQYGRGLYFAQNEDVSRRYRDQLTPRNSEFENYLLIEAERAENAGNWNRVDMLHRALNHDVPSDFRSIAKDPDYDDDYREMASDFANEMESFKDSTGNKVNFGSLYEVDIDANPDELIDWDKPISGQSDKVKLVLKNLPGGDSWDDSRGYPLTGGNFNDLLKKRVSGLANQKAVSSAGIDRSAGFAGGADELTARFLNAKGIKGIKYADAFTRHKSAGKQSSNYVIFNDELISIANKYGVTLPVAAAMLSQTQEAEAGQGAILLGAAKQGARIGQRFPTAVKATENPLDPSLVINTDSINAGGNLDKTVAAAVKTMPGLKTNARSTKGLLDAYREQTGDNLNYLYNQYPGDIVNTAKNWYRGANQLASGLANRYNTSVEQASGVLAALSPQKDWYQNVSLADRVFDSYAAGIKAGTKLPDKKHAKMLKQLYSKKVYADNVKSVLSKPFTELNDVGKAMWVRSHDQAFSDRGYDIISPTGASMGPALTSKGEKGTAAWGSNNEISKAIRVIENGSIDNISRQMGSQHKVRNFYNNIVSPEYAREMPAVADVTMDTHAIAAGQLMPLSGSSPAVSANFGSGAPSSAVTGASGTYGLNADAYRMAAEEAGIMPREMQSVTWEAVRNLYPREWKSVPNKTAIEGIWSDYSKGRINLDTARSLVLEKAGGLDVPNWAMGRDTATNAGSKPPVQQGNLLEPGVPGRNPNAMDSGARVNAPGNSKKQLGAANPKALGATAAMSAGLLGAGPKIAGLVDAGANAASGMIAPVLSAPGAVARYLGDRYVPGVNFSAEDIANQRQNTEQFFDYQPRTQLGQQYSDQGMQALGGLLAPVVDASQDSKIIDLLGKGYNKMGKKEKELAKALLDMSPI